MVGRRHNPSWSWRLADGYTLRVHREPAHEEGRARADDLARYTAILSRFGNTMAVDSFAVHLTASDYEAEGEDVRDALPVHLSWFQEGSRFEPLMAALWHGSDPDEFEVEPHLEEQGLARPRQRGRERKPDVSDVFPAAFGRGAQRRLFDAGEDAPDEAKLVFDKIVQVKSDRFTGFSTEEERVGDAIIEAVEALVERPRLYSESPNRAIEAIRRVIPREHVPFDTMRNYHGKYPRDEYPLVLPRYVAIGAANELEVIADGLEDDGAKLPLILLLRRAVEYLRTEGRSYAEAEEDAARAEDLAKKLAREYADDEANQRAASTYATDYDWPEQVADEFGLDKDALDGLIVSEFGNWYGEGPGDGESSTDKPDTDGWIEHGRGGRVSGGSEEEIELE